MLWGPLFCSHPDKGIAHPIGEYSSVDIGSRRDLSEGPLGKLESSGERFSALT